jgi:hypothetical protein
MNPKQEWLFILSRELSSRWCESPLGMLLERELSENGWWERSHQMYDL